MFGLNVFAVDVCTVVSEINQYALWEIEIDQHALRVHVKKIFREVPNSSSLRNQSFSAIKEKCDPQ